MKVLIPVDGSDSSINTVHWAAGFLSPSKNEALLINIYHCSPEGGYRYPSLEESKAILQQAASILEAQGISVRKTDCLLGGEAETICDYAERENVDQIILGSHGKGLSRLLVGSVSAEVIQCAKKPVFVFKNLEKSEPSKKQPGQRLKILLPVDGSKPSQRTLEWAVQFLDQDCSDIFILHVLPTPARLLPASQNILPHEIDEAEKILSHARFWFEHQGFHVVDSAYKIGDPPSLICEYADTNGIHLILLGSHGHEGVFSKLFGGVSSKVFQWAKQPVVIFNNADHIESPPAEFPQQKPGIASYPRKP